MCNNLYQELLEIIPIESCISTDNINSLTREKNWEFVYGAIKGFVVNNKNYFQILFDYYKHNNIEPIVYDILIGFVLYISNTIEKFKDVDILKNKQSICYGETFILDLFS